MAVYAKKVQTSHPMFHNRETVITACDEISTDVTRIPIPDNVVLCNGCNENICDEDAPEGYLIYLDKRELREDKPYDIYCGKCLRSSFKKAIMVEGK